MKYAIGKSVNLPQLWRPHRGAPRLPTLVSHKNGIDNARKKKLPGINQPVIREHTTISFTIEIHSNGNVCI